MTLSRRALAQLAVAAAASAQPTLAQPAASDELEQARKQVERNSQILREREIAQATEPAFLFKA